MSASTEPNESAPYERPRRGGPVTFAELTAGLIWPLILRAPALALQPARMIIAALLILLMWGVAAAVDRAVGAVTGNPIALPFILTIRDAWRSGAALMLEGRPAEALAALWRGEIASTITLVTERPISLGAALLALTPLWAIGTGAIARGAAVDFAAGLNLGTRESLRFALARWRGLAGAMLLPLLAAAALALVLIVGGWITLAIPGLNVVGAGLFGVLLLVVGLPLTLLLALYALGHGLLAPAVAVEATDSADAVQRVYAYLLGRPARALLYIGLLIAQGLIIVGLVGWLASTVWSLTDALAGAWLGEVRRFEVLGATSAPLAATTTPAGGASAAGRVIAFWKLVLEGAALAYIVSWSACCSTIVYLLLRRVNDEQDIHEVWLPGVIPGTQSAQRQQTTA
ncbi:MAG: hypothetical protein SFZ24_05220 [Planctomycetota bacterium]|nr:hypothetical protein [Planctomycetota bacterium]